jgi:hypothetical protein
VPDAVQERNSQAAPNVAESLRARKQNWGRGRRRVRATKFGAISPFWVFLEKIFRTEGVQY